MMRVGVFFDLDGTLLDSLLDLHTCVNHILRLYGCPERSLEQIRQMVGNGARNLIQRALPGKPTDPPLDRVLADYQAYYNKNCTVATRPYDGIRETLQQIRERYTVAVISNKPDEPVRQLCRTYFGDVYAVGVTEDCPRKPAPDMLWLAMKAAGVDTCVYIGDSETDVQTAKNAGVPCISVLWGFRDRACLEQAGATCFCQTPDQLLPTLERLLKTLPDVL